MAKTSLVGFFWVKLLKDKQPAWMNLPIDELVIARWDGECWYFTGSDMGFAKHAVKVFSPCMSPPGTPRLSPEGVKKRKVKFEDG